MLSAGSSAAGASPPTRLQYQSGASPGKPAPCAYIELPDDARTAFAYSLNNRRLTRFLTEIASASPVAQRRTLAFIVRVAESPERRLLDAVADRICLVPADASAGIRALMMISYRWNLRGFSTDRQMYAIGHAVKNALVASSHDEIAVADATSMLAPFSPIVLPRKPSGKSCSTRNADASIEHVAPLRYPNVAGRSKTYGKVTLKVDLSVDGDVRSVSVHAHKMVGRAGAEALIDSAILAAGGTTYRPYIANCVAQRGSYLFVAHFAP